MRHQKFEKNGKLGLIYNSELQREIGGVCASEVNSQLSCVLEAVDAATEVHILTTDLVVIIVF